MYNFIYNPIAGKGRAQRFRAEIEPRLKAQGVSFRFLETTAPRDAVRIAKELTQQGEADIVVMGGDGTVNEVLNGLVDPSKVRLGLIPCGSGNDFAAAIGIPRTPEGSLELILNGEAKRTDYLVCSGVRGLNVIGAGIDVDILKRSYRAKVLRGSLNYLVSLIVSLIHFKNYSFTAELDGRESKHEGFIVCACNGRRIGGGIPICPDAVCDDGKLDIVVVDGIRKSMIPGALIKLLRSQILKQKCTIHTLAPELKARFDRPTTIQIDGELYDNLPFDVSVVHDQLRVYR